MNEARIPEVGVFLDGILVPGILDVEITANNHLAANRYRVKASLTASGYQVWANDTLTIEIRVGMAGAWSSLMYGEVDEVDIDVGRGEIYVHGRDLTSRFIEARTQESFENQTSSDVALTLAVRRGLAPVITPTTAIIGRDFENSASDSR